MIAADMCRLWATHSAFDEKTQKEARAMLGDAEALAAAFGEALSFGTAGLRGILGVGTARMNIYTVAHAAQGMAGAIIEAGGGSAAVSYDSRRYSRRFAEVTAGVFAMAGIKCYLYNRLMPVPMLSFAVRALGCDAGVMITASHNPAEYNGFKAYGPDGCQMTDATAARVVAHMERTPYEDVAWMDLEQARACELIDDVPGYVIEGYYAATLARRVKNADAPSMRVVYSPLHGAGLEPVREIVKRMRGRPLIEVSNQSEPDGNFPTCKMPNPEDPDALKLAIALAKAEDVELVLATDPDCDRVGVATINPAGEVRVLSGNEIGLLLMEYLLSVGSPYPYVPLIVNTVVSSDLVFRIAEAYGAEVVSVLTGFKYIGEIIENLGERRDRFLLGFEESCGYLSGGQVRDKDAVLAVMLILDMAQYHCGKGLSLSEALDALYARYGYWYNSTLDFKFDNVGEPDKQERIIEKLRRNPPNEMLGSAVTDIKDYAGGIEGLPPTNMLSFESGLGDKAIVRPSGTEPKLKIYLSVKAVDAKSGWLKMEALKALASGWTVLD